MSILSRHLLVLLLHVLKKKTKLWESESETEWEGETGGCLIQKKRLMKIITGKNHSMEHQNEMTLQNCIPTNHRLTSLIRQLFVRLVTCKWKIRGWPTFKVNSATSINFEKKKKGKNYWNNYRTCMRYNLSTAFNTMNELIKIVK